MTRDQRFDVLRFSFENFVEVDIFYIPADGLRPSPWLALPVHVLYDATGTIEAARTDSHALDVSSDLLLAERVLGKTRSYAIDATRRVARGELVYAQSVLDGLRNGIVALEDLVENRNPGNCSLKIENRVGPRLLDCLYAACRPAEPAELQAARLPQRYALQ